MASDPPMHVAVEPLRCLLDPRPQTPHRRTRPPYQDDVRGLYEQRPQVLVAALGDLAQDRAIPGGLLLRQQIQLLWRLDRHKEQARPHRPQIRPEVAKPGRITRGTRVAMEEPSTASKAEHRAP